MSRLIMFQNTGVGEVRIGDFRNNPAWGAGGGGGAAVQFSILFLQIIITEVFLRE